MSSRRLITSSRFALALVAPLALAACGSSASAPNPATGASASVTGAASGSAGGTGTAGTGAGGGTVPSGGGAAGGGAAGGGTAGTGSLTDPVGVTVLNTGVGTNPNNIVQANVLSNTPVSNAPVQANVLANGQVVSASIASPGSDIPVVSPLVSTTLGAVATSTGLPVPTSTDALTSPAADVIATSEGVQKLGTTISGAPVPAPLNGVTGAVGSTVTQAGAALPATALQLTAASAPLNPLLNVSVGGTTLIGSSSGGSALTVGVDSGGKLLNTALTTPAGVPNPVDKLNSTLAGSPGVAAATGALSPVTTPLNAALNSGSASALTAPLGSVTGALSSLPAASLPVSFSSATTSTTAVTSPLGSVTGTLSGTLNGVLK